MQKETLYPLFLDLSDAEVLVVGAGSVALRKIEHLLSAGAKVKVVAPSALDEIASLAEVGVITWCQKSFEESDLACCMLVIGATDDPLVNKCVHDAANAKHCIVNIVDTPDLCNAIVPSVMQRGPLQIAVTTSGASPELARELRLGLEDEFKDYWGAYVRVLGEVRSLIKIRIPGSNKRRAPLYKALLQTDLKSRFEKGERPDAQSVYAEYVCPVIKRELPECIGDCEACK